MRPFDYEHFKATTDELYAANSTALAPEAMSQPSAVYCAPARLRDELAHVFDQYPLVVACSSDLGEPNSYVSKDVCGTPVLVVRQGDGSARAFLNSCRHRGTELVWGESSGCSRRLTCPYHGWTFGLDGRCVLVPSAADNVPPPPRAHLSTFAADERYGLVWLCVGTPSTTIPHIAEEEDTAFRRINTPVDVWNTSCTRMTDNFLDITHFPFVHTGTFGRAQDTKVPKFSLEQLSDDWYGYAYEVQANNADLGTLVSGQSVGVVERAMTSGFHLPMDVVSTIRYNSGLAHTLLLLSTPIDDVTSYFTFVVWRNDDFSVSAEEIIRFDLAIGAEDKRMLEMVPGVLPLDQTTLVNVQADKCSVEWRRRLIEFMST